MPHKIRTAVIGAGVFGRHHVRILKNSPHAELVGITDIRAERAKSIAAEFDCAVLGPPNELSGKADAAIVATPTSAHAEVGCALLEQDIDVLVEKPIASDLASAQRLIRAAERNHRILQIGHLERFNPAITALEHILTIPLFFEIHRLSLFSPRSLDVDVVLDLMIHDLDIVLSMAGEMPSEIRAAGISVLSGKVDIANVRLAFANGCVANLTASRVSAERVRKLRLFQPRQYISLDYERQQGAVFTSNPDQQIGFGHLEVQKDEPLRLEVEHFLECVATRRPPRVSGADGVRVLAVALDVLDKIREHIQLVASRLDAASWQRR